MIFTIIIPMLAWITFYGFLKNKGLGWRIAFLATSVAWGISVTFLIELLTLFSSLNRSSLAVGWGLMAVVAGLLLYRTGSFPKTSPVPSLSTLEKFVIITITVILSCTFVTAIAAPPNNWDSLTYHMTRIMFWIQQESVRHFPTNNLRQIELNPWAEFAITHLQLLYGGDRLANLVQWFSMAGCIIGVSLIAGQLGAPRRGQLLSALVAVTIPMAILQSTSTQNDLVVSFWLVCFVFFGSKSIEKKTSLYTLLMSCSLGLAILTKGTAYIYALPFVICFFIQEVKLSWRSTALKYFALASIVLFVNLGHYQRNYSLFHNPLHSNNDGYSNDRLTSAIVLSNVSRNAALHLITPLDGINSVLLHTLRSLHSVMGIAIDDPDTTWPGMSPETISFSMHEDLAGNILHTYLFIAVIALLIAQRKIKKVGTYALAVLAGFLLFSILLRWQPWASRLHLPLFVLFSPLTGVIFAEFSKTWITSCLIAVISLAAIPYIVCNKSRPLISLPGQSLSIFSTPRLVLYFANDLNRGLASLAAIEVIKNARFKNIGLSSGEDSWEYPLWILTREDGLNGPRIQHLDVKNRSKAIPQPPFRPDIAMIIADDGNVTLALPRN